MAKLMAMRRAWVGPLSCRRDPRRSGCGSWGRIMLAKRSGCSTCVWVAWTRRGGVGGGGGGIRKKYEKVTKVNKTKKKSEVALRVARRRKGH